VKLERQKTQIQNLKQENARLLKQLNERTPQIPSTETTTPTTTTIENQPHQQNLDKLKQTLEEAQNQLATKDNQIRSLSSRLLEAEQSIQNKDKQIVELQTKVKELTEQLEKTKEDCNAHQEVISLLLSLSLSVITKALCSHKTSSFLIYR
jgi:chromosome segregation ATPase